MYRFFEFNEDGTIAKRLDMEQARNLIDRNATIVNKIMLERY